MQNYFPTRKKKVFVKDYSMVFMFVFHFFFVIFQVQEHRIQLFPLMEDFDRVKNGKLSRSHFRRVLMQLGLGHLFTGKELNAIYKKFNVQVGSRDDFNYISFCDVIYALAGFIYRKP